MYKIDNEYKTSCGSTAVLKFEKNGYLCGYVVTDGSYIGFETMVWNSKGRAMYDLKNGKICNLIEDKKNDLEWFNGYIEIFWGLYPKKVDKKKSIEYLKKMIKKNPDKELFSHILHMITMKTNVTERKYWPSPLRYLRDELWEDEIVEDTTNETSRFRFHTKETSLERIERLKTRMVSGSRAYRKNGEVLDMDDPNLSPKMGVN